MMSATPLARVHGPMVTIERTFKAPPEKLWAMWTTKEGLEKWYWPEGLVAKVVRLDLRVGGGYEIAASTLEHTSRGTYIEIEPHKRLGIIAYTHFLQDVEPHERLDTIELLAVPGGTRLMLTSTRMRTTHWQNMSNKGWNCSLDKRARAVE